MKEISKKQAEAFKKGLEWNFEESISFCNNCHSMTNNIRQGNSNIFKCGKCDYFKTESGGKEK